MGRLQVLWNWKPFRYECNENRIIICSLDFVAFNDFFRWNIWFFQYSHSDCLKTNIRHMKNHNMICGSYGVLWGRPSLFWDKCWIWIWTFEVVIDKSRILFSDWSVPSGLGWERMNSRERISEMESLGFWIVSSHVQLRWRHHLIFVLSPLEKLPYVALGRGIQSRSLISSAKIMVTWCYFWVGHVSRFKWLVTQQVLLKLFS